MGGRDGLLIEPIGIEISHGFTPRWFRYLLLIEPIGIEINQPCLLNSTLNFF